MLDPSMCVIEFNSKNISLFSIVIPNVQRIRDQKKVDTIKKYQIEFFKKHGRFNFQGTIVLNTIDEKIYYLIDGQHRYFALKALLNEGYMPNAFVHITKVSNEEDIKENYTIINLNTPLPIYPENVDKNVVEEVFLHFENHFTKFFVDKERVNRPYVSKNHFKEAIAFLSDKIKINDPNILINLIETQNGYMSQWDKEQFKGISDKMYENAKISKFYLGLDKPDYNLHHYKWVKQIIQNKTGEDIKMVSKASYKKKKIPKVKRRKVWGAQHGSNIMTGKCYCCNQPIDYDNFECGHIIAEKNGGTQELDNLKPICSSCNKSMGTQNLEEFKSQHYKSKKGKGLFSIF